MMKEKEKTHLAPSHDSDAEVVRVHEIQCRREYEETESAEGLSA